MQYRPVSFLAFFLTTCFKSFLKTCFESLFKVLLTSFLQLGRHYAIPITEALQIFPMFTKLPRGEFRNLGSLEKRSNTRLCNAHRRSRREDRLRRTNRHLSNMPSILSSFLLNFRISRSKDLKIRKKSLREKGFSISINTNKVALNHTSKQLS